MPRLRLFHDKEENKSYLAVLIDFSEIMPILTDLFHLRGKSIQDVVGIVTNLLGGHSRKRKED